MPRNDTELVRDCLKGDERAWRELIAKYSRLVYSIPFRYGLSSTDADDVFQTTFTIACRELSRLRNEASLAAWLITITRRECLRLIRLRHADNELGEDIEDDQTSAPEQIEVWERQHLVRAALDQLDVRCRELLLALFLESPTLRYDQVASKLGIPLGSIGPTRARCFKKLQTILDALGVERFL
ncbi:MAG: sigma-70 family RNA polymerase sigma factor [Chloroflexi bacterium]|nr:sigma-70 family RNA polymerase sigma factor [Chloroflexota bacterium]